jgi:hypothetical protein
LPNRSKNRQRQEAAQELPQELPQIREVFSFQHHSRNKAQCCLVFWCLLALPGHFAARSRGIPRLL